MVPGPVPAALPLLVPLPLLVLVATVASGPFPVAILVPVTGLVALTTLLAGRPLPVTLAGTVPLASVTIHRRRPGAPREIIVTRRPTVTPRLIASAIIPAHTTALGVPITAARPVAFALSRAGGARATAAHLCELRPLPPPALCVARPPRPAAERERAPSAVMER